MLLEINFDLNTAATFTPTGTAYHLNSALNCFVMNCASTGLCSKLYLGNSNI